MQKYECIQKMVNLNKGCSPLNCIANIKFGFDKVLSLCKMLPLGEDE